MVNPKIATKQNKGLFYLIKLNWEFFKIIVVSIVRPFFVYHGLANYAVFLENSHRKKRKKFLDGQSSERTHGKRKVPQFRRKPEHKYGTHEKCLEMSTKVFF